MSKKYPEGDYVNSSRTRSQILRGCLRYGLVYSFFVVFLVTWLKFANVLHQNNYNILFSSLSLFLATLSLYFYSYLRQEQKFEIIFPIVAVSNFLFIILLLINDNNFIFYISTNFSTAAEFRSLFFNLVTAHVCTYILCYTWYWKGILKKEINLYDD